MVRKLKIYQTSQGFFDLAVATPSMKAALEAWGANSNLFHQGFAKEVEDPEVIAATLAKPGIVLKRPVGTNETYRENADLPTKPPATAPHPKRNEPPKHSKRPLSKADNKKAREAAATYGREERARERARRKEQAALIRQRERRQQAVDKAEAALDKAKQDHEVRLGALHDERAAIEKRVQEEDDRWSALRDSLQFALKNAAK